jgi:hypothetical protein
MQTKPLFITVNGNIVHRIISRLLILCIIFILIGCSNNMVTAGLDGISIEGGKWTGKSDDGTYTMQFNIGTDGANIFLFSFSYPCGEQNSYVLPPNPIKIELNNSAFKTTTTDYSDLMPKLVITGKFIDSTHAEGTWEMFRYQVVYLNIGCPAASGTWKGSPD